MSARRLVLGLAAASLLLPVTGGAASSSSAVAASAAPPAAAPARDGVVERRVYGRSVAGRPLTAWRLGSPDARTTVVLISTMHGDEPATRRILTSLRDGLPVRGIDLWVVPDHNPDGLARGTRQNARGVDLNRNFPYQWADLDGATESGSGPASEPETRAMMGFLREVRPDFLLSFHQPLHGVDTDTKSPGFARKVARTLDLPTRTLDCGGVCHGTMTGWYNDAFPGVALTVEYSARPGLRRMTRTAPPQVLEIFGARHAALGSRDGGAYPGL